MKWIATLACCAALVAAWVFREAWSSRGYPRVAAAPVPAARPASEPIAAPAIEGLRALRRGPAEPEAQTAAPLPTERREATVEPEGARVLFQEGQTTFRVTTNGTVTEFSKGANFIMTGSLITIDGESIIVTEAPSDGLHTTRYDEDTKATEGWIENGKREGAWTEWHSNGEVAAAGRYFHGNRLGRWAMFHANGERSAEGEYLYGEREGPWTEWDEAGRRSREGVYRNGRWEGLVREWHPSGERASDGHHSDNEPHGAWRSWRRDGSLESRGEYRHGRRAGLWEFFLRDGSLDPERSGRYENGDPVPDGR